MSGPRTRTGVVPPDVPVPSRSPERGHGPDSLLEDPAGSDRPDRPGPPGRLGVLEERPGAVVTAVDRHRGTLTYALPGDATADPATEPLILRMPITSAAVATVEREARLLVELRRRRLGAIEQTIPRHAGTARSNGLLVALASTVPGRPMCADRQRWLPVAQPWLVGRHLGHAGAWLSSLHGVSATMPSRVEWPDRVVARLRERWSAHPLLLPALARVEPAGRRLARLEVCRTVVHGDFWHDNILVDADGGGVSGVLNWYDGEVAGCPLRDLVRFALRYSHDLGGPMRTHRAFLGLAGLGPVGGIPGVRLALCGQGWYPRTVQAFLRQGLERLGLPVERWYDVALVGVAEIAAQEPGTALAEEHLTLLAGLPERA